MLNLDTIAAIVTAPAKAAVSIIRISGNNSWNIIHSITHMDFVDHQIQLAWIYDQDEILDQALILPFRGPKSFTGEDVIEIHCHGGLWISEKILELVLNSGARLAKPGEFTQRAVLNNKIDLSQAESIIDIIEAQTSASAKNAIRIYQGRLGTEIQVLRQKLLDLLGSITASIDFPDEVGNYNKTQFANIIQDSMKQIQSLLEGEREGHILRNGYRIAIIGLPNAGKSTLLNALLQKSRAIVTDIAGTTRDLIEENYSLYGIPIILIDTAGLRETEDFVEQIGIAKTQEAIADADLILELCDLSQNLKSNFHFNSSLKIGNKVDLSSDQQKNYALCISAKTGEGIEKLKNLIYKKILQNSNLDQVKINHRQADLLRQANKSLSLSLKAIDLAEDFWTIDLSKAIIALGQISGESLTEELLDNIFARFCIGK